MNGDIRTRESAKERLLRPREEARGYTRWWWFGCAVDKDEIVRELDTMKAAGIGGVFHLAAHHGEIVALGVLQKQLGEVAAGFQRGGQHSRSKGLCDHRHLLKESVEIYLCFPL